MTTAPPQVAPSPARPVVVVGAGPIGLAAAAHAQSRGLPTVVLEAGDAAGAAVRQWGHVRLFSAWSELVDPVAEEILAPTGWIAPDPQAYPTGADWVEQYLAPLATALAATDEVDVRFGHRVVGLAKRGRDRMVDSGREAAGFTVHVQTPEGRVRLEAAAVVDASGTWGGPSPLGGDGLPAIGEDTHAGRIFYGIPDFTDPATAARYAGKHVAVAGTGASALNTLVGLTTLAESHPATQISWLVRRAATGDAFGGGDNDQLEARGALGKRAQAAVESGPVSVVTSFRTGEVAADPNRTGALVLTSLDGATLVGVDEVVVVTGFRPDLTWLGEVRLDLDPVLSAPTQLAPLIDPNVHSCGTVYPHGAGELAQPETGLYLAGMKSYGRAPSFLALTGFEQTRSVIAAIAGDHESAARVELVLPESGVCGGSGQFDSQPSEESGGGCCSPAEPELITIGGGTSCG
ncbi:MULTISPECIES: FAD-dependent oxidoreductase [unclassified Nocardioides]|uniref:FAD-dependent oxidoreductase n=1 Tax=unclassified Nocardioides TaxID=2615069 RepID=UPI0009EF9510|nr:MULTISPECIES: FAD-dependent oxidoreductase [unclassified Nocardioides]GAW52142.1 flavin binding monooxygenase [Nocardioides sp. PD653-B2]GAW57071.1 flavin binding monooxygenase [Nocardioides sp. PD653]